MLREVATMRIVLRSFVSFMLAVGAAFTCSTAFAGELDGRWPCGKWTDDNTGHEGPLRGRFQQIDDCHYRAVFTGKFAKVVPFVFMTKLNVVGREGDKVILAGESRLPGMGKFT